MITKDRTERIKFSIPFCTKLGLKIDRKFLWFLAHGNLAKMVYPFWIMDSSIERPLEEIVSNPHNYSKRTFEAAAFELILRRRTPAKLKEWCHRWLTDAKERGRPRISHPSVVAVLIRDHFIERTGNPHFNEVGLMIWALFPDYAEKRRTGGGTTRQALRRAADDLCQRGPKERGDSRLTQCYLDFLKIYQLHHPQKSPF